MERKLTTEEVMQRYGAKIEGKVQQFNSSSDEQFSKSYQDFRGELSPKYTRYERLCKNWGGMIKFKLSKKDEEGMQKFIDISHLNVTPAESAGLALVVFLGVFLLGFFSIFAFWLLALGGTFDSFPLLLLFLLVMISVFSYYTAAGYPQKLATEWRLRASSQMVPAILYIVIYMKHTSNFEKAVSFASQHLDNPLAMDFKKVFWDVEIGRYSSLKQSVDHYLEGWRGYSTEFIEAFHLIESSLYEPSEQLRVTFLEKSLQVILDGVYDKMLKYTHNVKAPLTNIYMLGIILPTLSLAILPLATTMLPDSIKWYHLVLIFNILVPFLVTIMTRKVVLERPGGYGETLLLEKNPLYAEYTSKKSYYWALLLCAPLGLIGLLPLIWRYIPLYSWFGWPLDPTWKQIGLAAFGDSGIFGISMSTGGAITGPISLFSLVLSLLVPLSIALCFIIGNSARTKKLIIEREKYKEVEQEFNSSLFQLGNRLGDGVPPEIAFSKVLESTRGTTTEGFFRLVNQNIQQLGMSLEQAIFNPKRGAIVFYPSHLIETSMKILIESSKKGLAVAARSLMSISEYVKNIKKINDRLNDLLADIISDMASNMTFLAPLLSGIIVGLSGMINTILSSLTSISGSDTGAISGFSMSSFTTLFSAGQMVSPYWIQVVVGIYLIQVIFMLTSTLVVIKSGNDELLTTYEIGKNLKRGMALYLIVAGISIIGLGLLASIVLRI